MSPQRTMPSSSVPPSFAVFLFWLLDAGRTMGIHIMGTRGASKSRTMGRLIGWQDFIRGIPLVILDPNGGTIDNFLDKIARLPKHVQQQLWARVRYFNMSRMADSVVGLPLYFRFGSESLYEVAQRPLDVFHRLDEHLSSASVQGWNALWHVGTQIGMALAALGLQITEADDLINRPEHWARVLADAAERNPELRPVVTFLRDELRRLPAGQLQMWRVKSILFQLDPTMRAMFGASTPGIDWQRALDERWVILLDFRDEHDMERRRFKLLWVFTCLLEFLRRRGPGRHQPVSLIIDELTYLLSAGAMSGSLLEADLHELIQRTSRAYGIWLTIAHQELTQLPDRLQADVMSMGTQILGATTDTVTARQLARRFIRFDPTRVKKREPVYAMGWEIDQRTVEYSVDEQFELESAHFLDLPPYEFLVSSAAREGAVGTRLHRVNTELLDRGLFFDTNVIAPAREQLMRRDGRRIAAIAKEIAQRRSDPSAAMPTPGPTVPPTADAPEPARNLPQRTEEPQRPPRRIRRVAEARPGPTQEEDRRINTLLTTYDR
jgi:hypothetical protein